MPSDIAAILDKLAEGLIAEHGPVIDRAMQQLYNEDAVAISLRFADGKLVSRTITRAEFFEECDHGH